MKVLFDQGTPVPLRKYLPEHHVSTAFGMGWSALKDVDLLSVAEISGFDILMTTDQNLKYQQQLKNCPLAIVVLLSTSWPKIQRHIEAIREAVSAGVPGSYTEVTMQDFPS